MGVALCLTACSAEPTGASGASSDALLDAFIAARCDAIFRCGFDEFFENATLCRARSKPAVRGASVDLIQALASNRVRVDSEVFRRCIARINGACDAPTMNLGRECGDAFEGPLAVDAACTFDWECAGGSICTSESGACPRRCRPAPLAGEACRPAASRECASVAPPNTVTCYFTGRVAGGSECLEVQPRTAGLGEPCGLQPDTRGHAILASCSAGLYCPGVSNPGERPRCEALIPLGAPCFGYQRCAGVARCMSSTAGGMTCQPVVVRDREGESCNEGANGPWCNPYEHLACERGVCVRLGNGAEGSPCTTSRVTYGGAYCNEGLRCAGSHPTCTPQLADGAYCLDSESCRSRWCSNQRCRPLRCE